MATATGRSNLILYLSIALAMVGFGIVMPVLPFYMEALGGSGSHLGLLVATYGLMQLLCAPLWGGLSDTYGRKPFLLLGMAGLATGMLLFGLATELWMLYVAQLASGALSSAIYPSALAYVSDVHPTARRSAAIGRIGGAAGLGVILGPGIGGVLAAGSLSRPFFFAAGFALCTFLALLFFLPESLPPHRRAASQPAKNLPNPRRIRKALGTAMALGLVAAFAAIFGKSGFTSIFGLYALERFGHGPAWVGAVLMAMSLMYALAQGVLVGPVTQRLGEEALIRILFPAIGLAFPLMLLARGTVSIVLATSLFILLMALLKPTALSFVSQRAGENQGAAMGLAESFMGMGRILGPLGAGIAFDADIRFPFLGGAVIFGGLLFLSFRWRGSAGEAQETAGPLGEPCSSG